MTQRPQTQPPAPGGPGPGPSVPVPSISRPAVAGRTEWTVLWIWLASIVATALAAGVLVGVIGGVAVRAATDPTDGWRELAAFAVAVVLAVAGAVLVGVVGVALLVRRFVPRGRRAFVVGWALGVLVVVVAVTAASGMLVDLVVMVAAAGVAVLTPVVLIVAREGSRLRATAARGTRRRDATVSGPAAGE